jgi:hypothetical protein
MLLISNISIFLKPTPCPSQEGNLKSILPFFAINQPLAPLRSGT